MRSGKKVILFLWEPSDSSQLLNSDLFVENFEIVKHQLTTVDAFLLFLEEHKNSNIVAIYGGYPGFAPIGGLTNSLITSENFPRETLKCIVLCSRGYNNIDLSSLKEHNIRLYNYQDDVIDTEFKGSNFKSGLVGNDVADCVLWHVLEGFRKFSYMQTLTRQHKNTLKTRSIAAEKEGFAFGHDVGFPNGSKTELSAESPRGKKCLILGFGSIGRQIAYKLQHGLGLEVHYSKRTPDDPNTYPDWIYHRFDDTIYDSLIEFEVIIIALPGTPETQNLVDKKFLSHCKKENLIIVNIGRGNIIDLDAIKNSINNNQLRHFGCDVFVKEPEIDNEILKDDRMSSITPHLGSSTKQVFSQSCELALSNILNTINNDSYETTARII